MVVKVRLILLFLFLVPPGIYSQTCCSGGVPLTGNLGMPSVSGGTWQISPSYDLNYLHTLKSGTERLDDPSRKRLTQSILYEAGYSISDRFFMSAMFSYVFQTRIISSGSSEDRDLLHGIGDAVLLFTYRAGGGSQQGWELLLGAGPKLPLGRSDMRGSDGIAYNADLQPGSGAWDGIFWGLLSRQGIFRPTANISLRAIYRYTGGNDDYLGFTSYRFGNELQLIAGMSEQFSIRNDIFNPSLLFRYRQTEADLQGDFVLPNTGGSWLFIVPGMVYQVSPSIHVRLAAELPLYSNLEGIQLTTDFRFTAGLYFRISGKSESIGIE